MRDNFKKILEKAEEIRVLAQESCSPDVFSALEGSVGNMVFVVEAADERENRASAPRPSMTKVVMRMNFNMRAILPKTPSESSP